MRGLAVCLFLLPAISGVLWRIEALNHRNATLWLLRYQDLIVKRGFVGTMLHLVVGDDGISYRVILIFSLAFLTICIMTIGLLVFRAADRGPAKMVLPLAIMAGASPYAVQAFAIDLGRFDVMIVSMSTASLYVLSKSRGLLWPCVLCAVVAVVGMLIHEAFAFICAPMLIVAIFLKAIEQTDRRGMMALKPTMALAIPVLLLLTALVLYGMEQPMIATKMYVHQLEMRSDIGISRDTLVLHDYGVMENFQNYTWRHRANLKSAIQGMILLFILAGWVGLPIITMLRNRAALFSHLKRKHLILAFAASLAPMGLSIIAVDWGRWVNLSVLNVFLMCFWLLGMTRHDWADAGNDAIHLIDDRRRRLTMVLCAIAALTLFYPGPSITSPDMVPREIQLIVDTLKP